MSELRRNDGPDDGDKPADQVSKGDDPAARPGMEFRTPDQDKDRPVRRTLVTRVQNHFHRLEKERSGFELEGREVSTFPADQYSIDWETGLSADARHRPPPHTRDRTEPGDRADTAGGEDRPVRDEGRAESAAQGLPRLDGRAFQDADDGWGDSLAPAADDRAGAPDAGDQPGQDLSTPTSVPDQLGPDDARSASMSLAEAREQIAKSDADLLPGFRRDNSRLEARTVEVDDAWYDNIEGPEVDDHKDKFKSLRGKYAEKTDDIADAMHSAADDLSNIFSHPAPTHTAVGHIPPSPDMPDQQQGVHNPGDAAAGTVMFAFTLWAAGRMMHDRIENRKDRHGDNG